MSRCYSREQDLFSSLYVPPKPSCRRPLTRMVIGKSPKTRQCRYSLSPKPSSGHSRHRNSSEPPDISSDENDDQSISESDIDENDSEEFELRLSKSQQTPPRSSMQRSSPSARKERAEMQLECANRNVNDGQSEEASWVNYFGVISVIIIAVIIGYAVFYSQNTAPNLPQQPVDRISNFRKSIRGLKERFPSQNRRTWGDIEAGVINVINEISKPWTFVLFSNETKALSCLARLLGKASSEALQSVRSLELHPEDLGDDYGRAIDRWKAEISDKRAVVVHDLLNINPRAIQAFHTMCDRENPLVEGAVYILTIITRGNVPAFEKRVKFVEDQLTNRFINKVPEEKLQPLITRLTDGPIIPVKSEMSPANCQL